MFGFFLIFGRKLYTLNNLFFCPVFEMFKYDHSRLWSAHHIPTFKKTLTLFIPSICISFINTPMLLCLNRPLHIYQFQIRPLALNFQLILLVDYFFNKHYDIIISVSDNNNCCIKYNNFVKCVLMEYYDEYFLIRILLY